MHACPRLARFLRFVKASGPSAGCRMATFESASAAHSCIDRSRATGGGALLFEGNKPGLLHRRRHEGRGSGCSAGLLGISDDPHGSCTGFSDEPASPASMTMSCHSPCPVMSNSSRPPTSPSSRRLTSRNWRSPLQRCGAKVSDNRPQQFCRGRACLCCLRDMEDPPRTSASVRRHASVFQ